MAEIGINVAETRVRNPVLDKAAGVVHNAIEDLSPARLDLHKRLIGKTSKAARIAMVTAVLLAAGCGNINLPFKSVDASAPKRNITQEATPVSAPSTPKLSFSEAVASPTPEPLVNVSLVSIRTPSNEYIQVTFDKEHKPDSYYFAGDQEKTKFNINPGKAAELQKKAIDNKEVQLLQVIPVDINRVHSGVEIKSEHTVATELPADVLTSEELKQRGIEIIQADNTDLHLRKGIFEKGGLLEDYTDGSNTLTIALFNGSFNKIVTDPRYQKVKDKYYEYLKGKNANRDPEYYRKAMIDSLPERMSSSGVTDEEIALVKAKIERYRNAAQMSLLEELSGVRKSMEAGLFLSTDSAPHNATILASVGHQKDNFNLIVYIDSKGKVQVTAVHFDAVEGNIPASWQNYPNPNWFINDPNASESNPQSYAFTGGNTAQGQIPGFLIRHELAHNVLIGRAQRVKLSQFKRSDGTLDMVAYTKATMSGDGSEYHTDQLAWKTYKEAYDKWEKSGFKDNSGYYLVLRTSNGKGYIFN